MCLHKTFLWTFQLTVAYGFGEYVFVCTTFELLLNPKRP